MTTAIVSILTALTALIAGSTALIIFLVKRADKKKVQKKYTPKTRDDLKYHELFRQGNFWLSSGVKTLNFEEGERNFIFRTIIESKITVVLANLIKC